MSGSWPWHGRNDIAEGPDVRRWHQVVRRHEPGVAQGVVLLGFARDEGVRRNQGRIGASEGPAALRRALASLARHGSRPVCDAGDVVCEGVDLEGAQERLGRTVAGLVEERQLPAVLGGGHETAWGSFQGRAAARPGPRIGIINLDAHLDLRRDSRATPGTPFAQMAAYCEQARVPFDDLCIGVAEPANTAAVFATARKLGVRCWLDEAVSEAAMPRLVGEIETFAAGLDAIQLSIDLDVLPAAVMPALSAPAARGIALHHVEAVIAAARATGKLALAEIVELNPTYDQDGRAARTAARPAWQLAR